MSFKLLDEPTHQLGMCDQNIFHVGLAKGYAKLLYMLGVATQQSRLPPVEFSAQDKAIQAICFCVSVKDLQKALFKSRVPIRVVQSTEYLSNMTMDR